MTTEKLNLVITFAILGFYSTNIVTAVNDSNCVPLPQSCDIPWNVTANASVLVGLNYKIQQINATVNAIAEVIEREQAECSSAIRSLMCISAIRACNNTNSSLQTSVSSRMSQACTDVQNNCTEMVQKTFGSMFCPEIQSYNDSECVEVIFASSGYCPFDDKYKISAKDIPQFLGKASMERKKLQTFETRTNITAKCLTELKRITCITLVSTCGESSNITKESCELKLQCLPSIYSFNKTRLCSNFPFEPTTIPTTQAMTTTPYDITKGFNTTVITHLNTTLKPEYSNKSSSLYKSFAEEVTNGLKIAYQKVNGFQGVFIVELTCDEDVAVEHKVLTSSRTNVKVLEARLVLANITSGLYLEGKVVEANKECAHEDDHGHQDNHTDDADWVYMIVFVCITALLLLAMVLCHQSK